MTLAIGDHLVIMRNGKIVDPKDEAYHEYEVVRGKDSDKYVSYDVNLNSKFPPKSSCIVTLDVVE